MRQLDGQWYWEETDPERAGYTRLPEPVASEMPGMYWLTRAARKYDVTCDSVHALRMVGGEWRLYLRPNAVKGYKVRSIAQLV